MDGVILRAVTPSLGELALSSELDMGDVLTQSEDTESSVYASISSSPALGSREQIPHLDLSPEKAAAHQRGQDELGGSSTRQGTL